MGFMVIQRRIGSIFYVALEVAAMHHQNYSKGNLQDNLIISEAHLAAMAAYRPKWNFKIAIQNFCYVAHSGHLLTFRQNGTINIISPQ